MRKAARKRGRLGWVFTWFMQPFSVHRSLAKAGEFVGYLQAWGDEVGVVTEVEKHDAFL